ncbi:MAG: arginase family protein, partial [Acidimicrobiia bacterium]
MLIDDPLWPRADAWLAAAADLPDLALVGVPSSAASLTPSEAWRTPGRFRKVLGGFSTFDGERGIELEGLRIADLGDWSVTGLDMTDSQRVIEREAKRLPPGPVHAFVGGDNAITRPLIKGLCGGDLGRVGVLTLDAHHDVRSLDAGPTNGTPIRGLIEDGLPDGRVVQVGIHSFANSRAYREYCEEHGVRAITMRQVDELGADPAVAAALDELGQACDWIFVDFDIDVLDRAFAPACPGSRPGGMTPRQLAAAAWVCG